MTFCRPNAASNRALGSRYPLITSEINDAEIGGACDAPQTRWPPACLQACRSRFLTDSMFTVYFYAYSVLRAIDHLDKNLLQVREQTQCR